MKVSFNSDMIINLSISYYVFTIYHDAYYIFLPSFEKYKMWNKSLEEANAENLHSVYLEVCDGLQFAARIQLNLSLFTVSLHSCCKQKNKNGEKVFNEPHRPFAAPAKVKGYPRSPFQKKAFDQRALL